MVFNLVPGECCCCLTETLGRKTVFWAWATVLPAEERNPCLQSSSLHPGRREAEGLTQDHTAAQHRAGAQKPGSLVYKASHPVPTPTLDSLSPLRISSSGPHFSGPCGFAPTISKSSRSIVPRWPPRDSTGPVVAWRICPYGRMVFLTCRTPGPFSRRQVSTPGPRSFPLDLFSQLESRPGLRLSSLEFAQ